MNKLSSTVRHHKYLNIAAGIIACFGICLPDVSIGKARPVVDTSKVCDLAVVRVAAKLDVPISVLRAITITETGRDLGGDFTSWPWTVNVNGKGSWFNSAQEAQAFAFSHYKTGARSFDVGCFQLNYKWHGAAFSSIEAMFDPDQNATYAAEFLLTLYRELGDWTSAAGAYHSRTPKYSDKYKARFERVLASLDQTPLSPNDALSPKAPTQKEQPTFSRLNRFPLLQFSTSPNVSLGSLMPQNAGIDAPRLIGDNEL